uniref:G-protein coupled receptors family 1 profile domain-containing protein n=1 Tax=Plectus sambesii TaxID=2011161 RepID=A0A914VFC3_9BILA
MWAFTDTAQSIMMTAVSFDRLLAVLIPLRYFSFGPRYGHIVVGSVFGYCLISACTAWIYPIAKVFDSNATLVQAYCYVPGAVGPIFNAYYGNIRTVVSWGSIALYVLVIVLFARYIRQSVTLTGSNKLKHAQQRRLTITLSIQCLCHFILYIVPTMVVSLGNVVTSSLNFYILVVTNFNAIINLFIYWARQKEFRIATVCAFTGRSLPANMQNWKMPLNRSMQDIASVPDAMRKSSTWAQGT